MASKLDEIDVRRALADDSAEIARLLHDFNTEFDDPSPGVAFLAERAAALIGRDAMIVLLAGEPAHGILVLRLRPALWADALDAYIEELYVVPDLRGGGIGRALLEAALETARAAGAWRIELGTSTDDTAALGLYESAGFTNEEGPGGPSMLFYEREL